LYVRFKWLASDPLDGGAQDRHAHIGVGKQQPGRIVLIVGIQFVDHVLKMADFAAPHAFPFVAREPGMVGHEQARGDCLLGGLGSDAETRQGLLNGGVKVQQAPLGQLHCGGAGEEFGDGPRAVKRSVGGGQMRIGVGPAKPLRPDDLLVIDQCDAQAGHLVFFHALEDDAGHVVAQGFVVAHGQLGRGRRWAGAACQGGQQQELVHAMARPLWESGGNGVEGHGGRIRIGCPRRPSRRPQ
jgi:hypothetical protein